MAEIGLGWKKIVTKLFHLKCIHKGFNFLTEKPHSNPPMGMSNFRAKSKLEMRKVQIFDIFDILHIATSKSLRIVLIFGIQTNFDMLNPLQ